MLIIYVAGLCLRQRLLCVVCGDGVLLGLQLEDMYHKAHEAIRADPSAAAKVTKAGGVKKR